MLRAWSAPFRQPHSGSPPSCCFEAAMMLCCRRFGIDAVRRRMIVYDLAAAQLPCVFFVAGFGLPFGIRWVDGSKVPLRPSPLNPVSPPRPMRVLTRFGHSTADRGNGPQCAHLGLSVATGGDRSGRCCSIPSDGSRGLHARLRRVSSRVWPARTHARAPMNECGGGGGWGG